MSERREYGRIISRAIHVCAVLSVMIGTGLFAPYTFGQSTVFWINEDLFLGIGEVVRIGSNDSNPVTILTPRLEEPIPLELDVDGQKIYWAGSGRIERADLNGTSVERVLDFDQNMEGLALDLDRGKIYWTLAGGDVIQRSNLDGSGIEEVISSTSDPLGIALDSENGRMYWLGSTIAGGYIRRADLDGSNVEDLVSDGIWLPTDLELDLEEGKMYWTDRVANNIQRANLDGTAVEELIGDDLENPTGIALDVEADKMYWTDRGLTGDPNIQRANLDGSEVETVLDAGLTEPEDIDIDPLAGLMYWTDSRENRVWSANLDGTNLQSMVVPITRLEHLFADPANGRLILSGGSAISQFDFNGENVEELASDIGLLGSPTLISSEWSMYGLGRGSSGSIQRVDLSTGGVEVLADGLSYPRMLVVDQDGGKMYWAEGTISDANSVHRANLDGTEEEELLSLDTMFLEDLAVDPDGANLYWTEGQDFNVERIRTSKLDGSDRQTFAETSADQLHVEPAAGRLYWVAGRSIYRARLDGTDPEELVSESWGIGDLTVEAEADRMYWTTAGTGDNVSIRSARLDGSDMVELSDEPGMIAAIVTVPETSTGIGDTQIPADFKVSELYPNPFRERTQFSLSVSEAQWVSITLYDVMGRRVRTVHQGQLPPHYKHAFKIDGRTLPSGQYYVRVSGEYFAKTSPIILIR